MSVLNIRKNRAPWGSYLIALLVGLSFWVLAAALESAFHEPGDFVSFMLPRTAGELWMRLLLSMIVAFCVINHLDRDARLVKLEKELHDLRDILREG